MDKDKPLEALIDQLECTKASIWAKVEPPFGCSSNSLGMYYPETSTILNFTHSLIEYSPRLFSLSKASNSSGGIF